MRQPYKMVKHTQTICRLLPTKCLSVFDHFVGLLLKGLKHVSISKIFKCSILYPLKTADTLFFIRTSTFVWGWLFFFLFCFFIFEAEMFLICSYFLDWTLQCHKEECQTEYNKNTLFHFFHSFSFKQRT